MSLEGAAPSAPGWGLGDVDSPRSPRPAATARRPPETPPSRRPRPSALTRPTPAS